MITIIPITVPCEGGVRRGRINPRALGVYVRNAREEVNGTAKITLTETFPINGRVDPKARRSIGPIITLEAGRRRSRGKLRIGKQALRIVISATGGRNEARMATR